MGPLLRRFVVLAMASWLAACAGPQVPDGASLAGRMPDLAIEADGALYLRYPDPRQPVVLWASWPPDAPGAPAARYRAARLEVRSDAVDLDALRSRGRALDIRAAGEWQALLTRLLTDLAPAAPDEAALAVVQGRDIVFTAVDGVLRIHRHEDKPASLRVTRVVSDDELSQHAAALLAQRHGRDAALLFDTGGSAAGRALVFVDVTTGRSVWVAPSSAIGARGAPPPDVGLALSLADALVIRSHLLTPLTQPVSSLARLSWLTLQTALGLVPRPRPALASPLPPAGTQAPMDLAAFEAALDAEIPGSRTEAQLSLLVDGDAFFPRLVQAIQDARSSVRLRLYIFDTDPYALQLAELLRRRSTSIRVEVLLDQLGSIAAARAPGRLPDVGARGDAAPGSIVEILSAGSDVRVRTSANPWLTSDHVKTIVVDGRRVFLGGMNIGQEYRYEWHDAMVEAEGPLAERVEHDFRLAWAQAGLGGDLALWAQALRPPAETPDAPQGMAALRLLRTRTGAPEILVAHLAAIRRARQQILVEQPYLADDEMIAALVDARRRGVDVRVVLPTAGDSGFMNAANLIAANVLLRHGARVYAYPGMTHVKAALIDGWACVGSANFDKLSLRINRELNIATSDERFVAELRQRLFERDLARSRELTEAQPVGWSTYLASFIANQL